MSFSRWLYFWEKGLPLAALSYNGEFISINSFYSLKKQYEEDGILGVVCGAETGYVAIALEPPLGLFFLSEISGNFCPTTLSWYKSGSYYMLFNDCQANETSFGAPDTLMIYYKNTFCPLPDDEDIFIHKPLSIIECPDWLNQILITTFTNNGEKFFSETLTWASKTLVRSYDKMLISELYKDYVVDSILAGRTDVDTISSFHAMLKMLSYEVDKKHVFATTLRR